MTSGIVRGWWVRPHPSGDVECSVENVRNSRGVEEGALEVVRALPDLQPKPRARASRPEVACAWHGFALVNLGARARASVRECAGAWGRMADAGGDAPLSEPIHTLLHRPHESTAARAVVSVSPPRTPNPPPRTPTPRRGAVSTAPRSQGGSFPCRRLPVPPPALAGAAPRFRRRPGHCTHAGTVVPTLRCQQPGVHFSE